MNFRPLRRRPAPVPPPARPGSRPGTGSGGVGGTGGNGEYGGAVRGVFGWVVSGDRAVVSGESTDDTGAVRADVAERAADRTDAPLSNDVLRLDGAEYARAGDTLDLYDPVDDTELGESADDSRDRAEDPLVDPVGDRVLVLLRRVYVGRDGKLAPRSAPALERREYASVVMGEVRGVPRDGYPLPLLSADERGIPLIVRTDAEYRLNPLIRGLFPKYSDFLGMVFTGTVEGPGSNPRDAISTIGTRVPPK